MNCSASSLAGGGAWKVEGFSVTGVSHVRQASPCEDSCGWFATDELIGLVLADGAGSARHSASGSKLVIRTAVSSLLQNALFNHSITPETVQRSLVSAFRHGVENLYGHAFETGTEPQDLACTLLIVVAGPNYISCAHLGDGAVVIEEEDFSLRTLSSPTNGEFANETALLGCCDAVDVTVTTLLDTRVRSIAAFTDGIQRLALLFPSCAPHESFFKPLFERIRQASEDEMNCTITDLLMSPSIAARTHDDTTLALAHRS
jgi:hypothetical protein